MNAFVKIMAGLGAVVFTATAIGLPDVCGYCTARAMAGVEIHQVAASSSPHLRLGHATQVALRSVCNEHWHLPI